MHSSFLFKFICSFVLFTSVFPIIALSADVFCDEVLCDDRDNYFWDENDDWDEDTSFDWSQLPIAGEFSIAFDNFRSLPEGSWDNNAGALVGFNLGMSFPYLACNGFGIQLGSSYGVYDWSGRESVTIGNFKETQQQTFFTAGVFRKTSYCSGLNFAVAYDWMINKNFGVFGQHPGISQVRFKAGYLFHCCNEVGFWGAIDAHTSHRISFGIPVTYQAMSQINMFWEHYFNNCARTLIWAGLPDKKGLMFSPGRDGKYILGASFSVPLTHCLSIDGHAVYMRPRSVSNTFESRNYASNVCFGLTYFFGKTRDCCDGGNLSPYLPLANNSNFIVDTNLNF